MPTNPATDHSAIQAEATSGYFPRLCPQESDGQESDAADEVAEDGAQSWDDHEPLAG